MGRVKMYTDEELRERKRLMVAKSQKKRRNAARRAGMCIICCHNKAREGRVTCQECNDRAIESYRRRKGGMG